MIIFSPGAFLVSSLTGINVYVGDDKKLHFVDSEGADSVLPFSSCAFGTHTFTAGEVFEIDTGLSEIKHFVLYNDPTVSYENFIIYDSSVPTKYKYVYKSTFFGGNIATVGVESEASANSYKVMSISGGKITLKAPNGGSEYKWLDATWMAQ